MIIAKLLLGFLLMNHNNQELIKTMKKILQLFPEGIIIQEINEKCNLLPVEFINNTAVKELIDNSNFDNTFIEKERIDQILNLSIKIKKENITFDESENSDIIILSDLLQTHANRIQYEKEAITSIEVCHDFTDNIDENLKYTFFNVKTIKMAWDKSKNSLIHVFINTTALKHFEMEKARNE